MLKIIGLSISPTHFISNSGRNNLGTKELKRTLLTKENFALLLLKFIQVEESPTFALVIVKDY